jgi:hypothetical protein
MTHRIALATDNSAFRFSLQHNGCMKPYWFHMKLNYRSPLCCHMVIAYLYSSVMNFLFCETCLLSMKLFHETWFAKVSQQHGMSHKALLPASHQMGFICLLCKLFFRTHIYHHGLIVKSLSGNYCTHMKAPVSYEHISIIGYCTHYHFPEVGRLQYHWKTTVYASISNQNTAYVITNILHT